MQTRAQSKNESKKGDRSSADDGYEDGVNSRGYEPYVGGRLSFNGLVPQRFGCVKREWPAGKAKVLAQLKQ
jgi:hypothetical protein